MRRDRLWVSLLSVGALLAACQPGAGSDSYCGEAGQLCCGSGSCVAGLGCQAGRCAAGAACGARDQACCAGASACAGGLACQAGACVAAKPSTATRTLCEAGGTLEVAGATLSVPTGALKGCQSIRLSVTAEAAPAGYAAWSPVFRVEPDGLALAAPAILSLEFTGDAELATVFSARTGTAGFAPTPSTEGGGAVNGELSRLGRAFAADGVHYTEQPDPSCVVSRMVEGRTMSPSTVALFFTVDDCWGRALPGLDEADFGVLENGAAIPPAESSATILARSGSQVFTSLVIDLSASTLPLLPTVIESARRFVVDLQRTRQLPVQIDIQVFAGDVALTEWQAPTLDTDLLLARLDALAAYAPADRASTNLHGAVVSGLGRLAAAEAAFRDRNHGGAFTVGYLVLFTDGRDTAGRVAQSAAVTAVKGSADQVVAVGLRSVEYDGDALEAIALGGVMTATEPGRLATAFASVANRMDGQLRRFYLLGYCSPKRAGNTNTVAVQVAGATNQATAAYRFSAIGFAAGCSADTFATLCAERECGGLGCGACDDRTSTCSAASSVCVNDCQAAGRCGGETLVNARGYAQVCAPAAADAACGGACVDTRTDPDHCGGCGTACAGRCWAGACVP